MDEWARQLVADIKESDHELLLQLVAAFGPNYMAGSLLANQKMPLLWPAN
jgi:hypothetical protein